MDGGGNEVLLPIRSNHQSAGIFRCRRSGSGVAVEREVNDTLFRVRSDSAADIEPRPIPRWLYNPDIEIELKEPE
jgi:hypothetical protein